MILHRLKAVVIFVFLFKNPALLKAERELPYPDQSYQFTQAETNNSVEEKKEEGKEEQKEKQGKQEIYKKLRLRHTVARLLWYIKTKQFKTADSLFWKLQKEYPDSAETDYFRALRFHGLGKNIEKNAEALLSLTAALRKRENFSRAWNLKGILFSKSDRNSKAMNCFQKAVLSNPYHPDYIYNLAFSFYKLNQYEKAMKAARESLRLKPNFSSAYYLTALVHSKKGHLYKAFSSYTFAEEFGQKGTGFYLDYLKLALELNEEKEILRLTKLLSRQKKKNAPVLRILARIASKSGDYKKALRLLRRLVYMPEAAWRDKKNFVYVLEKNSLSALRYINRLPLSREEKAGLKKYAREIAPKVRRQMLLKTQDPVL